MKVAAPQRNVVRVEHLCDAHVAVSVEPLDKLVALVAQVALCSEDVLEIERNKKLAHQHHNTESLGPSVVCARFTWFGL